MTILTTPPGLVDAEASLNTELAKTKELNLRLQTLENEVRETTRHLTESSARESSLSEKTHDQERELQLIRAEAHDLKTDLGRREARVRELEDQIQNDDRADRLEESLKHTQDKADDLELKLTKLQQVSASQNGEYALILTLVSGAHHPEEGTRPA
jgi:chromosome segregation ATPase